MNSRLSLGLLLFVMLATMPAQSYARAAAAGWDFDILSVTTRGTTVSVIVASRSNRGLDGPVIYSQCKPTN